ncbi:MAG: GTPase Era [Bacteroidia bacterium]|nr:GTPase Era [Bacteroidia bacterium]
MAFKCGYVNIVGAPNVGKSTLTNALLGEKISIVTSKAQTTRQRILGISTTEDYQLIISDSPGYILKPAYELHKRMMKFVDDSFLDADVLIFLTDIFEDIMPDEKFLDKVNNAECPLIVAINKIDADKKNAVVELEKKWKTKFPRAELFKISALLGAGVPELKKRIIELLPEHPAFFEADQLSDRSERFIMSEIIREKIFLLYGEEVPYASEVVVTEFKDKTNVLFVRAEIWVERESQKVILLGKNGNKIKKLGTMSREDAERFFNKKIYLELFVKVEKDWRKNPQRLQQLGYTTE